MNKLSNFYLYLNFFLFLWCFSCFFFFKSGYLLKVPTYFSVGKYETIPCHIFCVRVSDIIYIHNVFTERKWLNFSRLICSNFLYESHFLDMNKNTLIMSYIFCYLIYLIFVYLSKMRFTGDSCCRMYTEFFCTPCRINLCPATYIKYVC